MIHDNDRKHASDDDVIGVDMGDDAPHTQRELALARQLDAVRTALRPAYEALKILFGDSPVAEAPPIHERPSPAAMNHVETWKSKAKAAWRGAIDYLVLHPEGETRRRLFTLHGLRPTYGAEFLSWARRNGLIQEFKRGDEACVRWAP